MTSKTSKSSKMAEGWKEKIGSLVGEKAFPGLKLPEITQKIAEYSLSLFPRQVLIRKIPDDEEESYSRVDTSDHLLKLLLEKGQIKYSNVPEPVHFDLATRALDQILTEELPENRIFKIVNSSIRKESTVFTLIPDTLSSGEVVDLNRDYPQYDIRLTINKLQEEDTFASIVQDFLDENGPRLTNGKIEALIKSGMKLNQKYWFNRYPEDYVTPLRWLVKYHKPPRFSIETLLKYGADPNLEPELFETFLDGPLSTIEKEDISSILLKYGWEPVINERYLKAINLNTLKEESPFIYDIITKRSKIVS